ncbi:sirohydrochlorin cobaltochelatase [Maridesulfovibrio hydrothermalis]|uniref:Anaerobic cobalt chelatase n=1 Tax=Maridesulfovibrio hydrothermalis AM13 = DSM 14728 TaxID=1121451 RepID=L0RCI5_9BACT|nr:sirohydrochlorin cobaltochelatase [Maridesulfovibrio hydrothermalis]CCO23917.1 Anaerobic cobalt chelatase [Maridesulfovibrio hydrothermalis AM13 = DSM 14728]
MRKAILFAAHGSKNTAANSALGNILKMAEERHPDLLIKSAFTSRHVLKRLKEQGQDLLSIKQTLENFSKDGITHVVVQSLHVIPGTEFANISKLVSQVDDGKIKLEKAVLGNPLLTGEQEIDEISDMILSLLEERDPENEALVLVAHGSKHSDSGNSLYDKFKEVLERKDKNAYLGKLNVEEGIVEISEKIKKSGVKKAYLLPLLFGAGNHVIKDMAGNHDASWKNIVASRGIKVVTITKGIGEFDVFANRWMDNLQKAIKELEN